MIEDILKEAKEKFGKVIDNTKEEFSAIRTGRANAGLFSGVMVNYYGAPTPLLQLASITIPENRVALINPFDKGAIDAVVKGLQESDLGVNPAREGDSIRVTLPELTKERRQEYVKLAKNKAEDAKVALRSVRHKAMDGLDKLVKDKEVGEDEAKRAKESVEKVIQEKNSELEAMTANKEQEIMSV